MKTINIFACCKEFLTKGNQHLCKISTFSQSEYNGRSFHGKNKRKNDLQRFALKKTLQTGGSESFVAVNKYMDGEVSLTCRQKFYFDRSFPPQRTNKTSQRTLCTESTVSLYFASKTLFWTEIKIKTMECHEQNSKNTPETDTNCFVSLFDQISGGLTWFPVSKGCPGET